MKRTITLAAALVYASASLAQMQEGPASFTQLDVNKDGSISVTEAQEDARLLDVFAKLDANQDGSLDRSEYAAIERAEHE